jgi:predicted dehydrogenase
MADIGIGVIGAGRHGTRYLRHLAAGDVPGVKLAGVARSSAAGAAETAAAFGCRPFPGFRELCADPAVDAVAVVVRPDRHPEVVAAAAACGKAVLLEKPAALGVGEGRRLLEASRRAGIPVMVAQTLRYNGVVRALAREAESLGRIHALRISQRFEPSPLSWVDDPALGGILFHTGVHSFDLLRVFSGAVADRVRCVTARVGDVEAPNHFSAVVELDGGAVLATVSGCRATASRTGAIELAGERGQLVGDHALGTALRVTGRTTEPLTVGEDRPTIVETLMAFAGALRSGQAVPIPLEDGLRAAALAEACRNAAASGRAETVARITEGEIA